MDPWNPNTDAQREIGQPGIARPGQQSLGTGRLGSEGFWVRD